MRVMLGSNVFISMIFFPFVQTKELPFELVYTPKTLDLNEFPQMRDTKDSPILATATMEGIDVFVTGDKDFLVPSRGCSFGTDRKGKNCWYAYKKGV